MMPATLEPATPNQLASQSYYKFNDVLERFELKPYILRFWESEFEQISPIISDSGQKIYTPSDLYFIQKVKDLLLTKKLPIQKAKLMLDTNAPAEVVAQVKPKTTNKAAKPSQSTSATAKPVEVRRFKKSMYSKSHAQTQLNEVRANLQAAQDKIEEIRKKYNWV